jgi:hypothetical protein
MPPHSTRQSRRLLHRASLLALLWLGGCGAVGDFGRVRPSLVRDDIHAWVGQDAAVLGGAPISPNNLTEDELTLRDLAYPLISPPYDRPRWYSVLKEYGVSRVFRRDWWVYGPDTYLRKVIVRHRSSDGSYNQLIDDIRNDIVRIGPFFDTARRVADMDRRREKSMEYVADLSPPERIGALARIGENTLTIGWVHRALSDRCAAYRYALERLVVGEPSRLAVDAERALTQLQMQIAANRIVPVLRLAAAPAKVAVR